MNVLIRLTDIQHVKEVEFSFNLESNGLICIAGKNGTGKTTLVKAIRNITNADTFKKTSSEGIFNSSSSIIYEIDGLKITFEYDQSLKSLNCKEQIPDDLRASIAVELPIPHGERFNFFQRISNADADIRKSIILNQYTSPKELTEFLQDIYQNKKFENLIEISIRSAKYYCSLLPNGRYLREDYLSSGEYFLISLYRRIMKGCRLIVIDEIDISLDAAAQVRLVKQLREFGRKYRVIFVFTTHSLAMMRTLHPEELFYMDQNPVTRIATITNVSYNYVKSILFGFTGWDKYILTEDDVLKEFLEHVIQHYCGDLFYKYRIIFIGGASNTTDLMKRNSDEHFLADAGNVIAVLDGDQRGLRHSRGKNTYCIPIDSVEKALLADSLLGHIQHRMKIGEIIEDAKELTQYLNDRSTTQRQPSLSAGKINAAPSKLLKKHLFDYVKSIFGRVRQLIQQLTNKKATVQRQSQNVRDKEFNTAAKKFFQHLVKNKMMSKRQIFEHLCKENEVEVTHFSEILRNFLTLPIK